MSCIASIGINPMDSCIEPPYLDPDHSRMANAAGHCSAINNTALNETISHLSILGLPDSSTLLLLHLTGATANCMSHHGGSSHCGQCFSQDYGEYKAAWSRTEVIKFGF